MKIFVITMMTMSLLTGIAIAQNWAMVPGVASDIAVGEDGIVWIVGSESRGYLAFHWDDGAWVKAPRSHWLRIDAGADGSVYAINRKNQIFSWKNGDWKAMAGEATDIAVGLDGSVFIIGSENKGHRIYKWNNGSWIDFPGSNYKRVAVDPSGNPHVVTQDEKIFRWRDGAWQPMVGKATDIAVGAEGELYIIGNATKGNGVFRWEVDSWKKLPGNDFRNLSIGPDGTVWATKGENGKINRFK
ncbi:MAG TPA: hypothetical protein ENH10_05120 [Bacteroidetes bacterium]|nr:hypothetical protein [Bacteroidota bacterium]HEX04523.1 hypothetical protein [Bacteroidota bacterium]